MQYLCLGNRDKKYIEILAVSDCDECKSAYQRNVDPLSINLSEDEFYKIKIISENNKMNKEIVIIQAESFIDARKIIFNNNYQNLPAYANCAIFRKTEKFIEFKNIEKKFMLSAKKN